MILGCIGDVDGRACHALALLARWQAMRGRRFDLVVQVGDLGVIPDPKTGEMQYDDSPSGIHPSTTSMTSSRPWRQAQLLGEFRQKIAAPILVVAGNHDELSAIPGAGNQSSPDRAPIDPHGLLPGCWTATLWMLTVKRSASAREGIPGLLAASQLGQYDVLVSHEGGFGDAAGDELSSGPEAMIQYLRRMKPRFHLFGHFHHAVGPVGCTKRNVFNSRVSSAIPEIRAFRSSMTAALARSIRNPAGLSSWRVVG